MIKNQLLLLTTFVVCGLSVHAQLTVYDDYVGGGHSEDILISSSSNFTDPDWSDNSSPSHTIDGEGLNGPEAEAARFLYQAALGGSQKDVSDLAKTLDFEQWIDDQINLPPTNFLALTRQSYLAAKQRYQDLNGEQSEYLYNKVHFQYAFWQATIARNDLLRQRVAFALSEILVISTDSDIRNDGDGIASYYNVLMSNAFGNYRDLLEEITYHPAMGIYLSHFRNRSTDLENNVYPDENFAREIMQLFSIGLFELYQNGNLKSDSNGDPIPTYDADDIRNLAKVMTGFGAGALTDEGILEGRELDFNAGARILDYTVPMAMYDEFHEPGEKIILGNKYIPDGLTGQEDVDMALDYIFNHPNTAPFFVRRLIQQMVKSNPSPSYIYDVAQVFNDNGEGVRGDLESVIKAILLHEEARDCLWKELPSNGKLKAPAGRFTQIARSLVDKENNSKFWMTGYAFENETYHLPLSSPSVFNFYLPDYQPNGEILNNDLYAPEFEIHNSVTSIGFANQANAWSRQDRIFSITDLNYSVPLQRSELLEMAQEPEVLVNELDMVLCFGEMTEETRNTIINALQTIDFGTSILENRVEVALYLTMISPDFAIQK